MELFGEQLKAQLIFRTLGKILVKKSLVNVRQSGDNVGVLGLLLVSFVNQLLELADTGAFLVFHQAVQFDNVPHHVAQFLATGLWLFWFSLTARLLWLFLVLYTGLSTMPVFGPLDTKAVWLLGAVGLLGAVIALGVRLLKTVRLVFFFAVRVKLFELFVKN